MAKEKPEMYSLLRNLRGLRDPPFEIIPRPKNGSRICGEAMSLFGGERPREPLKPKAHAARADARLTSLLNVGHYLRRLTLPANHSSLAVFGEPNRHGGDAESWLRKQS